MRLQTPKEDKKYVILFAFYT